MPRFSFQIEWNGWLMLGLAALVTVLVAFFYRRALALLKPRQGSMLFLLRMTALAAVLLLLFRPVLSFQREMRQAHSVVFAVDQSASMGIADGSDGVTRWQQACDQVLDWCREFQSSYQLRLIAFSDEARSLDSSAELLELAPTGQATSLSRALTAARRAAGQRPVEAVVLVSDGIHNTAGDPVGVARRLGLRVFTVGAGDPRGPLARLPDVRVIDLDCPHQMTVGNKARISVFVEAVGMAGQVVPVELYDGEQLIASQELVLDDVQGGQEMILEFVPATTGPRTYTARIPPQSREKIIQNNTRSASAYVGETRIRVLYLEGTLRAEYGAVVGRFLAQDPNIEFCALVQTRPNVFLQRSNIPDLQLEGVPTQAEQWAEFDVFVIGDLDVSFLPHAVMQLIHDRVMQGAGLLMMGGYHGLGPGGYGGTLLEELLPVRLGPRDIGQATDPFQPCLTAGGERHPIFANIAAFFPRDPPATEASELPALSGCVIVLGRKPGADVLLTHPELLVEGAPMVVMAVQPVDEGRTAVFTADTTRNWHQALRAMEKETPFLRFWGQLVRWLAGSSQAVAGEAGIVATTDRADYEPEQIVRLEAIVRGAEGAAATAAQVTARIRGPRGQETRLPLPASSGAAGRYAAAYEPPGSGRYTVTVTANVEDAAMTADPLQFDVGRPNLEFDELALDEATLVAIADETQGDYFHLSLADRLSAQLRRIQQRETVLDEWPLARPSLLWTLFVASLSCEWWLRRRFRLR